MSSNVIKGIGIILLLFGIACGDSPNLLVPMALVASGGIIYKIGEKAEVKR